MVRPRAGAAQRGAARAESARPARPAHPQRCALRWSLDPRSACPCRARGGAGRRSCACTFLMQCLLLPPVTVVAPSPASCLLPFPASCLATKPGLATEPVPASVFCLFLLLPCALCRLLSPAFCLPPTSYHDACSCLLPSAGSVSCLCLFLPPAFVCSCLLPLSAPASCLLLPSVSAFCCLLPQLESF